MNQLRTIILVIGIVLFPSLNLAATITAAVPGGEWTSGASWVGGVVPSDGDVVIIPAGSTITITEQIVTYTGTLTVTIESGGLLSLVDTGFNTVFGIDFPVLPYAQLVLGAGSSIVIDSGGTLDSSTEADIDPNNITIGTNFLAYVPGAAPLFGDNPQSGPVTLDDTFGGPTPIELIFFEANELDGLVNLSWASAMEYNFDYFSLERSADGYNFKEIAQIFGSGQNTTSRTDYSYTDESPFMGTSYYRLTSIDFDGYTEVFDYVFVKTEGLKEDFSVYPNPIQDNQFNIQTNFDIETSTELVIYNNVGRVEATYTLSDWHSTIESVSLHPGSYIFKLATSEGVIVRRVLVK